jgi:hypothetical protein
MKTVTLSATFDGEQIRLEDDYPLPKDARLLVTVLPSPGEREEEFRRDWYGLAADSLAKAYSHQEPEYTLDMLKEPNPDYEAR